MIRTTCNQNLKPELYLLSRGILKDAKLMHIHTYKHALDIFRKLKTSVEFVFFTLLFINFKRNLFESYKIKY